MADAKANGMKRVVLGKKLEASQCCLGTMTWGAQNTEADAHAMLDYFVANGGNFIDTAELYPVPAAADVVGRTESYIGSWIKAKPSRRQDIILGTKVTGPRPGGWIRANRKPEYKDKANDVEFDCALTGEQIKEACTASLKRLNTEYVDLYQLHWPERYSPTFGSSIFDPPADGGHDCVPGKRQYASFEEQVRAVGELISEGKIRYWGVSNETSYGVSEICHTADRLGIARPISIQNDHSLIDRRFETELAETCFHHHVSLLAYGPLAGGTLSGKYTPGFDEATPAIRSRRADDGSRHHKFPNFQPRYHCEMSKEATAKYCELARQKGFSPTALALGWSVSRRYIKNDGCVIIGSTTLEQLKENMGAMLVELDKSTLSEIDRIHRENPNPNLDMRLSRPA